MKKLLTIFFLVWVSMAQAETHNAFPSVVNVGDDTVMVVFRSASDHVSSDGDIKAFRGIYSDFDDTLNSYILFESPEGIDYRDPSISMIDTVMIITLDRIDYYTARNDICLIRSYDNGTTWDSLENVTANMLATHRWWTSTELAATESGVWVLPSYRWEPDSLVWSAGTLRSLDRGRSWEEYVPVVYGIVDSLAPSEPSVVQLDDGSLFLLAREDNFECLMYFSYSFDDGASWEPAEHWYEPGAAPWVAKDVDGHILASYGAKGPWGVALTKSLNASYPLEWGDTPRAVPYTDPAVYSYPSLCRIESLSNDTASCYFLVHNIEKSRTISHIGNTLAYLPRYQVAGIDEQPELPSDVMLQAYPNPFNAVNILRFSVAQETDLQIDVINVMGQKVARVFDGVVAEGINRFAWDASEAPSGTYFYRVKTGAVSYSKKITLLK